MLLIGAHIISGAVFEPTALHELFPEDEGGVGGKDDPAPLRTAAAKDRFCLLTERAAMPLPILSDMHNGGNWIVSLSELCRWLGRRAEALGASLFPGFAGSRLLLAADGRSVRGVATNDVGVGKDGRRKATYARGLAIRARLTLLAEGAHGSLSKQLVRQFGLREHSQHQTYGLGLKEVWEVARERHQPGLVWHGVGWPLDRHTYGGSFLYHWNDAENTPLVSVGLIVGLDYADPYLNLYEEFQRLKTHPAIRAQLEGGRCIAYGARALNEGGIQSVPSPLAVPGAALIGCAAGFVNVAKIKGTHTAMKSGMLAAEAAFAALCQSSAAPSTAATAAVTPTASTPAPILLSTYEEALKASWVWNELWRVRNIRPAFHRFGLYGGLLYSGLDQMLAGGRLPWTLSHGPTDAACLRPAAAYKPRSYPRADGRLTFDLLESVSRTGTNHEEDQPVHLQLADPQLQVRHNLPTYAGPEPRFCPAGVYEYVETDEGRGGEAAPGHERPRRFQINAQNCIHCKTCDIKDPAQNINWTVPEGGGGPKYTLT